MPVGEREFLFTDENFECVRRMLRDHAGIALSDAKRGMVYSRLARRLRALGLSSFADYCHLVSDGDGDEFTHFINALTTNLTAFFREAHHFEYLTGVLLPQLRQVHARDRRLRIWSAGCSIGEEPYSIAMALREAMPDIEDWDVRILATDIDSNVIETASRGIYALERVTNLEPERLRRWFRKGRGNNAGLVKVVDALRSLISFRTLNLMHDWPMRGPFDVIFCRNVVIYFDKPTQRMLFERMAELLPIGGHLFIGHSESLFKVTDRFENLGRTIYRRIK
ncbi:protein-glutamate O-methyltransferase CheR [Thiohalobacter sp. IOR34]|nr:protein-glutamate O-methyltransferase CheR [Thiohalobacter sp. IOR34]WJW76814.1 protein-glutamate O-methyltransferase CheR [Thiohalobacter sp. IOR34]